MKLEINYRKKIRKATKVWQLNKVLLNNNWVNEEIKNFLETNGNENTTCQNLWEMANVVLRGKFIAIQAYLHKQKNLK